MQLYNFNIIYYRYDDDYIEQFGVYFYIDVFSWGWYCVDGEDVFFDDWC